MNQSIGTRLRNFGDKNFPSLKEFAKALDVSPQHLQPYLNDIYAPGTPLLIKLRSVGCDINWLLMGDIEGMVSEPEIEYGAKVSENERIKQLEEENEILRSRITAISELSNSIGELKKKQSYRGKRGG